MLLIVAVHTIYLIADSSPGEFNVLRILLSNSSMLFIFISGYLFQYLLDRYTYASYLGKKFKNVILPYIIMSVPAIFLMLTRPEWLDSSWINTPSFQSRPVFVKIILFYATGSHLPQFWFIPMISIFYLISPILRYIDRHPAWYAIIPGLIIISLIVDRPPMNDNTLQSFVYFLPVYLLGMHTSHYAERYFSYLTRNWVLLLVALLVLTAACFVDERFSYLQKLPLTFLCLFMFYKISSVKLDTVMGLVAKYSFGIFFIHKYTIILVSYAYVKLSVDGFLNSNGVGLIFSFMLIVAFSILLLVPFKLIFKKNSRLITGC
jgi:surface polysaccharide O-acyltransferase-like enzyme